MPFLFVDYDQGAGGEYFCQQLSMSAECVNLTGFKNRDNRTKINDIFEQEFLKILPEPKFIEDNTDLYHVVPSHRNTELAKSMLDNVRSIRIANPVDAEFWDYLKLQQNNKVLDARLPSDKHFLGELRMLLRVTENKEWVKNVKSDMDNLSLIMLAKGLELTEKNKNNLKKLVYNYLEAEPNTTFDLVIAYEDLFNDTEKIKQQIKDIFNITITGNWLERYRKDYDTFLAKT